MKKITTTILLMFCITFFAQNKLTSSLSEFKDDNGVFQNSNQTTYAYDENDNLTEEKDFFWNSDDESWTLSSTTTYTYNNSNKATNVVRVEYENGQVIEQDRTLYTYNQAGNITELLDQELQNGIWVNEYKSDFIYVNNILESGESYEWEEGEWIPSVDGFFTELFYDDNGNITRFQISANKNTLSEDDERGLYTYDSNGKLITEEFQFWDGTAWIKDFKLDYTYDVNGNVINEKEEYNDDGELIAFEETNSFDTSQLLSEFVHPFKDKTGIDYLLSPLGYVNKITSINFIFDSEDSFRTTYIYEGATASVNEDQLPNLSIYPNPTKDFVTIEGTDSSTKSISVFNVLGKKIKTVSNNTVSLAELSSGIYVIKITTTDGKIATRRVVKK